MTANTSREIIASLRSRVEYTLWVKAYDTFAINGDLDPLRQGVHFPDILDSAELGRAIVAEFPWSKEPSRLVEFAIHSFGLNYRPKTHQHGAVTYVAMPIQTGFESRQILSFLIYNAHFEATHYSKNRDCMGELLRMIKESPYDEFCVVDVLLDATKSRFQWKESDEPDGGAPDQDPVLAYLANTRDEVLAELLASISPNSANGRELLAPMFCWACRHRPAAVELAIQQRVKSKDPFRLGWIAWGHILKNTDRYDPLFLAMLPSIEPGPILWAFLNQWLSYRNTHLDMVVDTLGDPKVAGAQGALNWLASHSPERCVEMLRQVMKTKSYPHWFALMREPYCDEAFDCALGRLDSGGLEALSSALSCGAGKIARECLARVIASITSENADLRYALVRGGLRAKHDSETLIALWRAVGEVNLEPFLADLWDLLGYKSKSVRETGVDLILGLGGGAAMVGAIKALDDRKAERRLGAVILLEELGGDPAILALSKRMEIETNDSVRTQLRTTLLALRGDVMPAGQLSIPERDGPSGPLSNERFQLPSGSFKLPTTPWLRPVSLPPLSAIDGIPLTENEVAYLFSKQSKHKSIDAAPDILPLLALIEREKSAPFAAALVEGFLNSGQAASDRWALTLGGLLGDSRIIPPLLSRINDWCENSRCKLAEYAAQAISLLPGNEPLMVLDTLANRYRSKFKNVGKACAEAFNAAAAARGITTDELGDLVVPDFGFDCEGIRCFEWEGGGASAELGADFKLTWFDPDTEKSWKALPANAPDEIKTEVKTLTKLLREAVKGQTARLEMTLVRQRRWAVTRWRELFENHALLRSFASNLVWGVYDGSGTLLRTFRRYPNGLLADAAGSLEELPETDTMIGMVHPLELMGSPNEGRDRSPQRSGEWNAMENAHETSADSPMDNPSPTIRTDRPEVGPCQSPSQSALLDAWRAHLARFNVKPPFPQIDRPVELLDPLHGNRREISLTKEKKLSAGTFRSRAEKRGWTRGSVVDAGGISSYYKLYPGAGVEVVLPIDHFYIGCDPMETIELCAAFFAKAGSVGRGSYAYSEPAPDDPQVLRFDQVPAVVYSETITDLKAIIATNP